MELKETFILKLLLTNRIKNYSELVSRFFALNLSNIDNIFDQFVNIIPKTIDKHALFERMSRKQRKLASKPWITIGI